MLQCSEKMKSKMPKFSSWVEIADYVNTEAQKRYEELIKEGKVNKKVNKKISDK